MLPEFLEEGNGQRFGEPNVYAANSLEAATEEKFKLCAADSSRPCVEIA